jgi:hypothetical protein
MYAEFFAGVFPYTSVVDVVDVACDDGLHMLFYVEAFKGSHDVVVAVVGDFYELVGRAKSFCLLFYDFEAVENVGFHVDVGDKACYFVSLLDYFVQGSAAVFTSAPVNNHFHVKSTSIIPSGPVG